MIFNEALASLTVFQELLYDISLEATSC